jgi:periplasmic divalent cation tolerance protein
MSEGAFQPMMVLSACASTEEALRIARIVVNEGLAACAQVQSPMTSIYRWQGTVEESQEVMVFCKTTHELYPKLETRITELHSCDTPEIVALPITRASAKYLDWLFLVLDDADGA